MIRKSLRTVLVAALALSVLPFSSSTVGAVEGSFARGVYGRDKSTTGVDTIRATGFNAVTVMPYPDHLNALHADGLKGLVWLWGYDENSCSFSAGDEQVAHWVNQIKGHPALLAYQVTDEPNYARVSKCPDVVAQIRARSDLIKSIDPTGATYVTISTWDGRELFPYQYFAGTTDIMGLVVYPCGRNSNECGFEIIDQAIAAAKSDGVDRFWAVIQDFEDGWYRLPSPDEVVAQFDRWEGSGMEGYFVYDWSVAGLDHRPDHLAALEKMNARAFDASAAESETTPDETVQDEPTVGFTRPRPPSKLKAEKRRRATVLRWRGHDARTAGYL